jgi:hypothetical protein|tara:strand:- start:137 stop:484 length:348 start_codon:yes stop_codon:yes gene_type:complete
MAGYLEIPITGGTGATSITNKVVISKESIISIQQGTVGAPQTNPTTLTHILCSDGIEFQLTHTAAAAGFSVLDSLLEGWTGSPGNGVSKVGGIPATVSATGQALTFVTFTQLVIS